jgi:tetratricopeptide (TPR) repeat protein
MAAIERLHAGRRDEHLERLALHAVRSESWDKAVAHGAEAAARAKRRWPLRGALASFEPALAALGHLPRTRDNLRRAVDLHVEARSCLVLLGDVSPMLAHLEMADDGAAALEDDALRALVTGHRAHTHWLMGQHRRTLELAEVELDLARRSSDPKLEAYANFHVGEARYSLGEFEQAAGVLGRALTLLVDHPLSEHTVAPLEVTARRWQAQALVELGRFDEAARLAREAIEIARGRNHPYALANGISAWAVLCARRGNFQSTIPLLEEALQFSRTLGFQAFVPGLGNLLAEACAHVDRSAEARTLLDQVPVSRRGNSTSRPLALLQLGRLDDAREVATGFLSESRKREERGDEAWLLWLLGEIAVRESSGNAGGASARFREALALAEALGMRPLAAHCHASVGKLCRRAGEREHAREHLTTATTMYREMDMQFWLGQAETEMAALS